MCVVVVLTLEGLGWLATVLLARSFYSKDLREDEIGLPW